MKMKRMFLSCFTLILLIIYVPIKAFAQDSVTISFAGDCTLGSYKGSANTFAKYWDPQNPGYYFQNVRNIFAKDDITFVNLEGPLTDHPQELVKSFSMRGEPEYAEILKSGSVEVVNLSNNHIYDCGQIGFEDTVRTCQNNKIMPAGEGYIARYQVNGITVCFLGYKGWQDTSALRDQISNDIRTCKEENKADLVCVEFHWGEERVYTPNNTQKNLAHFTIDSGADIVVGAHPHVLQGIEKYNGHLIAYSLGNFCFGGNSNPSDKDTMILQTKFDKAGNLIFYDIIPCTISSVDKTNDFCPTPQNAERGNQILARIKNYSSVFSESGYVAD